MAAVIDLERWRREHRRARAAPPVVLLEQAVGRLDPEIARLASGGAVDPRIETELLAITGAVAAGDTDEALRRARRLADRLEHPSAHRP